VRVAVVAAALALAGCLPDATELDEVACPQGGTELTYDGFGQFFLAAHCQSCHARDAPARNGAPAGTSFDSHADVVRHRERIFARAAGGNTSMPPGPDDPPRAERDLLAEWLACGAP
jgi:uncharacterized membrane protein